MKQMKSAIRPSSFYYFLSVFSLVLGLGIQAYALPLPRPTATPKPTPGPTPVPTPVGPNSFSVDPDSLRTRMITSDLQIYSTLLNVETAKTDVDVARTALLPSVNVSALVSGNFVTAAIQVLLPFLEPGNWFNLAGSKNLLHAQGMAFNANILNLYANVESMYLAVVGDQKTIYALQAQLKALGQIVQIVQTQVDLNLADPTDLAAVKTAYDNEKTTVLQAEQSFKTELEAVRQALALPLDTVITFKDVTVPASPYESSSPESLLNFAIQEAPENQQLTYLIAAGKDAKWSAAFAWLGSGTLDISQSGSSFSVGASGTVNLGFGPLPQINLANENIESVGLQQQTLVLTVSDTLAVALNNISIAKQEVTTANDALKNANASFNGYLLQYKLGLTDLLHVLQAHDALTTNTVQQIQSVVNMNASRVALHRALITDEFKKLPTCDIDKAIGTIFSIGANPNQPMEKACGITPITKDPITGK